MPSPHGLLLTAMPSPHHHGDTEHTATCWSEGLAFTCGALAFPVPIPVKPPICFLSHAAQLSPHVALPSPVSFHPSGTLVWYRECGLPPGVAGVCASLRFYVSRSLVFVGASVVGTGCSCRRFLLVLRRSRCRHPVFEAATGLAGKWGVALTQPSRIGLPCPCLSV